MRNIKLALTKRSVKYSIFWIVLIYFTLLLCDHLVSVSGLLNPYKRITMSHVPDTPYQKLDLLYGTERIVEECNSLGLRDREYNPTPKGKRIIAIGDSFTFGHGVHRGKNWVKILEQNLWSHFPDDSIEVINAGYSGSSPHYYVKTLRYTVPRLNPTHVLLCIQSGDLVNTKYMMNYGRTSLTYVLEEIRLMYEYRDTRPIVKRLATRLFPNLYESLKVINKNVFHKDNQESAPMNHLQQQKKHAPGAPVKASEEFSFRKDWQKCRAIFNELIKRLNIDHKETEQRLDALSNEEKRIVVQYIGYRVNHDKGWDIFNKIFYTDSLHSLRQRFIYDQDRGWEICKKLLMQIIKDAKNYNVIPIFTYFPGQGERKEPFRSEYRKKYQHTFEKHLIDLCRDNSTQFLDISHYFDTIENTDSLFNNYDGHWNEDGNQFVAEVLEKEFEKNDFLPVY